MGRHRKRHIGQRLQADSVDKKKKTHSRTLPPIRQNTMPLMWNSILYFW